MHWINISFDNKQIIFFIQYWLKCYKLKNKFKKKFFSFSIYFFMRYSSVVLHIEIIILYILIQTVNIFMRYLWKIDSRNKNKDININKKILINKMNQLNYLSNYKQFKFA